MGGGGGGMGTFLNFLYITTDRYLPNEGHSKITLPPSFFFGGGGGKIGNVPINFTILQSLHWLPIKDRIVFKILLLIFHCVQGSAPQYNISLVHPYIPARNLRSSTSRALIIPKSTKTWGQRAFAHAGPYLWNSLPEDIKNCKSSESFKNHLKTYPFTHC